MEENNGFSFEISLSVLNHLGRNLYRSFVTVLGEAISNAWDADAENVQIFVDKEQNTFTIIDDGIGMSGNDFQNKFLKIGYTKRKERTDSVIKHRPYIGRKGIGKLALLSCADKITIMSKITNGVYVGGTIDNSGLDTAIKNDWTPDQYKLEKLDISIFENYTTNHSNGTLISFTGLKDGINKSPEYLRKILSYYFRFSLFDKSFNMFLNGEKITEKHLEDLGKNTQFLWIINKCEDPFIKNQLVTLKKTKTITVDGDFSGFIATVEKPRQLKVITTDERVSIDLFTNGRLRERDILTYVPSARIVENYLYGQIHFNGLDDDIDRFSSSREGIVTEDPKFTGLLKKLKENILNKIIEDWDIWRDEINQDGDPENTRITKVERKSKELYNTVSSDYISSEGTENKEKVDEWIKQLADDAKYNFGSYAECFVSENLIRKYIEDNNIKLSPDANKQVETKREAEKRNKKNGNCNIDIRQKNSAISYLEMAHLASLVDTHGTQNCLPTDAKEYKPIRDALMHTALLTEEAKTKLTSVFNNIRGRVKTLISRKQ